MVSSISISLLIDLYIEPEQEKIFETLGFEERNMIGHIIADNWFWLLAAFVIGATVGWINYKCSDAK